MGNSPQSSANRRNDAASFAAALVDESPDALIALTPDGKVLSWNRGACEMFGFSFEEAVGRSLDQMVTPADRCDEAEQAIKQVADTGVAVFESVRLRKDRSAVYVQVSMRAVNDAQGDLRFIAVNKKDVSQLKLLREDRVAELRFQALLEAAPDAMVMVGKDGRIVLVNGQTEKVFGYKREELLGQPIEILVPEKFRGAHPKHRHGYFGDPRTRAMGAGLELFGRRKDGTEFPAEISLSPMETDDGRYATAAIRDITERKKAEQVIIDANRMKSEFLANMSHELRTPLNAIIGFAELMHRGRVGPVSAEHKEYLGDILTSSKHLLQLINDVLDLSKVESGKMENRPEKVDLAKLIGEVRDILRGLAASKRIHVSAVVDPAVASAVVDPSRLKQVLYNYLSNAIKFTPEEGRVAIKITPYGPTFWRLEVADTGIGIRTDDLVRLFVEFQQLDTSSAKKHQGTGLGLALTKRIVESCGGKVRVNSSFGNGSTFSALFPRETRAIGVEPVVNK